jgi:hypothetical protein
MQTKSVVATKPAKNDQITAIKRQAMKAQEVVNQTTITNDDDLVAVADQINVIKRLKKEIRTEMEKYTKPAQAIINEARAKYLPLEKICDEAESQLKAKVAEYMDAQEAKRLKEEEKIVAKIEAGRMKEETGIRKIEELGNEVRTIQTENTQLQRRKVRVAYIVNAEIVPQEYWIIDEVRVKRDALAGKLIPGVEIREETQIAII